MSKKPEFNYPELGDVLDSLECDTTSVDDVVLKGGKSDTEKSYTFETHPFYSQIGDLGDLDIPDSDIY